MHFQMEMLLPAITLGVWDLILNPAQTNEGDVVQEAEQLQS